MKFFIFIFLFVTSVSFGQSLITEAIFKTTGFWGTGCNLPFWMTHNQLGKYASTGNGQQLTEGQFSGDIVVSGNLHLNFGANPVCLLSEEGIDLKIIQAYMGLTGKIIRMQIGVFADQVDVGGLSTTNGDLVKSLNFRPYPKVRLSTPGFIPLSGADSWFWFNAEYDEGLLTDERIINRPHLHHKSLMMQFRTSSSLRLIVGINHNVFWGGSSTQLDPLPDNLKSYIRYVIGSAGSSDFLESDQLNVAGNHLGSYLITAEKDYENFQLEIRLNHPFEDGSGMGFENLKDNLYAFHFRKNKTGTLLDEWMFEYLHSKHQSGDPTLEAGQNEVNKRGNDNYFNNGIYQTGFTYWRHSMGTPLFEPIKINSSGVVSGVANNRVSAFHVGAKGFLSPTIGWKGMLTYSRNFGTYSQLYDSVRQQFYSLAQLSWKINTRPLLLSAFIALDLGQLVSKQIGTGIQAQWTLR